MRLISIESGGDWGDASYSLIRIEEMTNLKELYGGWKQYQDGWQKNRIGELLCFADWLLANKHALSVDYEAYNQYEPWTFVE